MATERLALDRGIARGIVSFRWATLAWATIGLAWQRSDLDHAPLAVGALALAGAVTLAATLLVARHDDRVFAVGFVALELAVGVTLLLFDGVVFDATRQQSLAWAWPAAGIFSASIVLGVRAGIGAALIASMASFVGESILRDSFDWSMAVASKSALYVLAAVIAATVAARLRDAEAEISTVRAREEMARTLHDGVLQTLAVVQRRSRDADLVALAREQDRDLRAFLFEVERATDELPIALRRSGDLIARRHGVDTEVVLADDLPSVGDAAARALVGAVTEALTNAAKHSGATRIVVYAEPDEDDYRVFCSVRDDGAGFDVAQTATGHGLRRSIHERMAEVGGQVEIDSAPGRGTEVRLWVR